MSKYAGTIEFKSERSLFVFETARRFARLSFFGGIIAVFMLVGRNLKTQPTAADITPIVAFFGFWVLVKIVVALKIKNSMAKTAKRRGMTPRQYKAHTSKSKFRTTFEAAKNVVDPKSARGQEFRAEKPLKAWQAPKVSKSERDEEARQKQERAHLQRSIAIYLSELPRVRKHGDDPYGYAMTIQKQGQAIVDRECRNYAIRVYALTHDNWERHQVIQALQQEGGKGPVTYAINGLVNSVHYKYRHYFEGGITSKQGDREGYYERESADKSLKKVYRGR